MSYQVLASDISPESAGMMATQFESSIYLRWTQRRIRKISPRTYDFLNDLRKQVENKIKIITIGLNDLFDDVKRFDNQSLMKSYFDKKASEILKDTISS